MAKCQTWHEDEDGNAIQVTGVCDKEAEWVCCVPFTGALCCTEHKCRCATKIGEPRKEDTFTMLAMLIERAVLKEKDELKRAEARRIAKELRKLDETVRR